MFALEFEAVGGLQQPLAVIQHLLADLGQAALVGTSFKSSTPSSTSSAAIAVLTALRLLPSRRAVLAMEPLLADSTKSCIW